MELETYVLEETEDLNLGDAESAYNDYPLARENFQKAKDEYTLLVGGLQDKRSVAITRQDIEKVDNIYENVKQLQQDCLDMKTILSSKLESLIMEIGEIENDLNYHDKRNVINKENIEWGNTLLQEALEFRNNDKTMDAVRKAYMAKKSFSHFLAQANSVWIQIHQKNVDSLAVG